MRARIIILLLMISFTAALQAQQPENRRIRVADTLTAQEKLNRNAVLLRSELDSLIKLYAPAQEQQPAKIAPIEKKDFTQYIFLALVVVIVLLGLVAYMIYRQQQNVSLALKGAAANTGEAGKEKPAKSKLSPQAIEAKIIDLNAELHKLSKENEGMNRVIKEYNGIQHEYDSLRHGLHKVYKVKNYPGYDKTKNETAAMQGVFDTENTVANYAYEKFLRPILDITDANKNSPAKLNTADREKLIDLLVSLSLLYIEYLYLRIKELAVGGKMVERIKGFSNGKGIDTGLLKKLNTEFGSRALVVKMALEKSGVGKLSYPIFDETNLNNQ